MAAIASLYGQVANVGKQGTARLYLRNSDGLFEVQVDRCAGRQQFEPGEYLHVGGALCIRAAPRGGRGDVYIEAVFCSRALPDPTLHFKMIMGLALGMSHGR